MGRDPAPGEGARAMLGGCRQWQGGKNGQSWGHGAEFGTEISAKGWREPLDPEIPSHRRGMPLAELRALARGAGTRVTPAAGLDLHLLIPTASRWG